MSQGLMQGSLREASFPDAIQAAAQMEKSGCFHVDAGLKRAKIFLIDGRIMHAISNLSEGLDAVYEVMTWPEGQFRFEEITPNVRTTITQSNTSILKEMHRLLEEWRVIQEKVTSLDLYPLSGLLPGEAPSGVNPRQAKLLSLSTGFYTVAELAEVLQTPVLAVAKEIYGLVTAKRATLKGVRSGKRPELPPDKLPVVAILANVATPPTPAQDTGAAAPLAKPAESVLAAPIPEDTAITKLTTFAQRIAQTGKGVLPAHHHELVDKLHGEAVQKIARGEGLDAVKRLALAISRGALEADCEAETLKTLNAQLKALFR